MKSAPNTHTTAPSPPQTTHLSRRGDRSHRRRSKQKGKRRRKEGRRRASRSLSFFSKKKTEKKSRQSESLLTIFSLSLSLKQRLAFAQHAASFSADGRKAFLRLRLRPARQVAELRAQRQEQLPGRQGPKDKDCPRRRAAHLRRRPRVEGAGEDGAFFCIDRKIMIISLVWWCRREKDGAEELEIGRRKNRNARRRKSKKNSTSTSA